MSHRVSIRISYGHGLEAAEAEHLGRDADGSELFRVWRPGRFPGDAVRVDVLRLRRQPGEGFDFVGVAEPSRRGTAHLTIASACLGMPACDVFRRQLEEHGCVVENESRSGDVFYLVVSHPTDAPVREWHALMLRKTIGIDLEQMPEYLRGQARARERQRGRRRARQSFTRAMSGTVAAVVAGGTLLGLVGLAVAIVGGGVTQLFAAGPPDRPRVAAIGMLVALAPALFSRDARTIWPLLAVCAAAGIAAVAMLSGPAPAYGAAAALGALYALCLGVIAVLFGIFSGFSSSDREMGRVVVGVVLPTFASALAAAAVAVTSVAAAGRTGGLGNGARVVAVGLTALLLLGPAAVLLSNAAAILGGDVWRANPKLQLRALATLPRTMAPALLRVGIPIALIWAAVWLLGRLG